MERAYSSIEHRKLVGIDENELDSCEVNIGECANAGATETVVRISDMQSARSGPGVARASQRSSYSCGRAGRSRWRRNTTHVLREHKITRGLKATGVKWRREMQCHSMESSHYVRAAD